jgi:multisubunit Na+/H+ antiporter MnhF subunit
MLQIDTVENLVAVLNIWLAQIQCRDCNLLLEVISFLTDVFVIEHV